MHRESEKQEHLYLERAAIVFQHELVSLHAFPSDSLHRGGKSRQAGLRASEFLEISFKYNNHEDDASITVMRRSAMRCSRFC
mmetsp:Transcript_6606/g.9664  ORF Transcript_6606/g.9664 Transcript_6606/m.9664 type:complete len:82 (+) Transcript_6606:39-284(+)